MILPAGAVCVSNPAVKEQPPQGLVDLLARLGLVRAEQVYAMRGRVRRLARDLPVFESVWVDALAQARILTPYQADEINAGRGTSLQVGSYVIRQPLPSPGYVRVFRAWDRESRRWVRLSLFDLSAKTSADTASRLKTLVRLGKSLPADCNLLPVTTFGTNGNSTWAASPDAFGQTVADWMVHHGRFPPAAAVDIARQMLAGLLECEQAGIVHGDLGAGQILLDAKGQVWLPAPGLRPAIRPEEGYGHAALPSEAYDGLAPERVTSGGRADVAGDLYACGCLWWLMLAGRPAIPGATGLAKMRAAQTARVADIRQIAPDVDPEFADAIACCLARDPRQRPRSVQELAERLAARPQTRRRALAKAVARSSTSFRLASPIATVSYRASRWTTRSIAAAGLLAAAVVGIWPLCVHWLPRAAKPEAKLADDVERSMRAAGSEGARPAPIERSAELESEVVQASWVPPETVLELETDRPLRLAELPLSHGQTIRGRGGRRPQIVVPPGGLNVDFEDLRFENVDFACGAAAMSKNARPGAIIRLRAWRASFIGCSFQSLDTVQSPRLVLPAAVEWLGQATTSHDAALDLPTGELSFERCAFRRVSAAVRCQLDAAPVFNFDEVLHLGPGPLVALSEAPAADEPVSLTMSHATVRGAAGLVECRYKELGDATGRLAIQASNCAFFPAEGSGLVLLRGPSTPEPLIEQLVWSGQGSVLARRAPLALWEASQGRWLEAAEDSIQVDGLVRTDVGFAGDAEDGPEASRIVRWQVPLQSTDPPGIGERAPELPNFNAR